MIFIHLCRKKVWCVISLPELNVDN